MTFILDKLIQRVQTNIILNFKCATYKKINTFQVIDSFYVGIQKRISTFLCFISKDTFYVQEKIFVLYNFHILLL